MDQRTVIVQLPPKCLEVSRIEVLRQDFLGQNAADRVQDQQSASPLHDPASSLGHEHVVKATHEFVEANDIRSERALGRIGSSSVDEYLLCAR
jgi:hypothetical protein